MKDGILGTLVWERPDSVMSPLGFALTDADSATQAIDMFGLPTIPAQEDKTPLSRARYLLKAASEIEHGLLIQYLYAAYSIDPAKDQNHWATQLINIAIQEMDHLICVQNMLMLIKQKPYFDRANFPIPPDKLRSYPFPFRLEPLSSDSLAKYVTAESPYPLPDSLSDADKALVPQINQQAAKASQVKTLGHVGTLYMKLYWLFQPDDNPTEPWKLPADHFQGVGHLGPGDFADPAALANTQADAQEFRGTDGPSDDPSNPKQIHRVVWKTPTAAEALKAINQIAAQGEGTQYADDSHFEEFLGLYKEFNQMAGPGRVLPLPADPNSANFPDAAKPWAALFNARYRALLLELAYALTLDKASAGPAGRGSIISRAIFKEMGPFTFGSPFGVKGLSLRLAGMAGGKAAAPFELPADPLPTDPAAVKNALIAALDEAGGVIDQILKPGSPAAPTAADQTALTALKADLAAYKQALTGP